VAVLYPEILCIVFNSGLANHHTVFTWPSEKLRNGNVTQAEPRTVEETLALRREGSQILTGSL
jgi:hypothetical protein